MKVIILAGGSGTRLWPLSRENYPKQFIKIKGESLLAKTYKRLLHIAPKEDVFITTNEKYKFYVINDLFPFNSDIEKNLILEPLSKNTAGALLLSLKYLKEKVRISAGELIFISPSDHIILDEDRFFRIVKSSLKYARKSIVTFGIVPTSPHTGYGYIELGKKISGIFFKVKRFTEKPPLETARNYISSGNYLWNSGMFLSSYSVILGEFKKYMSRMYHFYSTHDIKGMVEKFTDLENISLDYAIIEKSKNLIAAKSDFSWSDVGSWETFFALMPPDENANVKVGDVLGVEMKNSAVYSDNKRIVALIDVNDLVVVNTEDALLIAKKGSGEKVKEIVQYLHDQKNPKALEHTTVYRPWGGYTVLEEGERYKIKRIFVKPGHKLSYQMHHHRSEHWIVIKGTARITIAEKEYIVHENESIFVPKSTKHRLENPGKVPLEIIEVQNGEYLGEDDIIRFEDLYGRETLNNN